MGRKGCGCWPAVHTTVGRPRMEVDFFYKGTVLLTFPSVSAEAMGGRRVDRPCSGSRVDKGQQGGIIKNEAEALPKCSSLSENSQANLSGQLILPSSENTAQSGS